jgi:hypothetical protein
MFVVLHEFIRDRRYVDQFYAVFHWKVTLVVTIYEFPWLAA